MRDQLLDDGDDYLNPGLYSGSGRYLLGSFRCAYSSAARDRRTVVRDHSLCCQASRIPIRTHDFTRTVAPAHHTQPPADDQVQCAITALDEAMALEKQRGGDLVIA